MNLVIFNIIKKVKSKGFEITFIDIGFKVYKGTDYFCTIATDNLRLNLRLSKTKYPIRVEWYAVDLGNLCLLVDELLHYPSINTSDSYSEFFHNLMVKLTS